jgi:hypothetical protein
MIGHPTRFFSTPPHAVARIMAVLGALLLFAQWGAVAHAHSHDHAPLTQHSHTIPCGECTNFAPLLASAAESCVAFSLPFPPVGVSREDIAPSVPDSSLILGFRSRAPPASC